MAELLRLLGQVGGFAALVVAVLAIARDQRRKQLIEIQGQLYDAQKEATAQADKRLVDERANCASEIKELQGRVTVLESAWGKSIAEGVAIAVLAYLKEHLENPQ